MTTQEQYTFGSHDGRDYLIPESLFALWQEMDDTDMFLEHPRWQEISDCRIGGICNYRFTNPVAIEGYS